MTKSKITTGTNDRPKNEAIAQTGSGLPDDSSRSVEVDEEAAGRFEEIIRGMGGQMKAPEPPYDVASASKSINPKAALRKRPAKQV